MNNLQTDNSMLVEKIAIRLQAINEIEDKNKGINILECFSGNGIMYKEIKRMYQKKLSITRIDIKPDRDGFYLIGDNRKYLKGMSLSKYNIIDIDAYGIPYEQIKIIMQKKWHGILIVTHIRSIMGMLPIKLLEEIGIKKSMTKKIPTMMSKFDLIPFKQILHKYGCKKIHGYFYGKKSYFWCKI